MNKQEKIQEVLERGVAEIIGFDHLKSRLASGKKLRIKLGIDPTSPHIHIGRAVVLWKLRAFQDLGHQVIFIVGDFTGLIGDTSDKDSERPMLDQQTVRNNLKTYFKQAFKILDSKKTETYYNSSWLKKLGFLEIGQMADLFSLHEFSARENIKRRTDTGQRVGLRELLYPLMQGYDSVAVRADVEIGGTDQKFNLLAGRKIQPSYDQAAQAILTMELLEGTDGRKMSSSWGNTINVTDSPEQMFGKTMSISDKLIKNYFISATRVPLTEITKIIKSNSNPRDQKLVLAWNMVSQYFSDKIADQCRNSFIEQFTKKQLPTDIKEISIKPGKYEIIDLLVISGLVKSKAEARRLLVQGGVKLNQKSVDVSNIMLEKSNNILLQVGKRNFVRIK